MREIFTPTEWRLPHWLLASGIVTWFAIQTGLFSPRELAMWFAGRPEVMQAFAEPHFGRADALMLIFATLFLGPFALFIAAVLLVFVMAILGGAVLPAVRWMHLPDWFATGAVAAAVTAAAWIQSHLWLPPTLWFASLLARAWRIILA